MPQVPPVKKPSNKKEDNSKNEKKNSEEKKFQAGRNLISLRNIRKKVRTEC